MRGFLFEKGQGDPSSYCGSATSMTAAARCRGIGTHRTTGQRAATRASALTRCQGCWSRAIADHRWKPCMYFVEFWRLVWPVLPGRDAVLPRIWNT